MKRPNKQTVVTDKIRAEIESGRYANGVRMPTEAEYSARFHVSRQTVRKALGTLEAENLITRIQGSGSYANTAVSRKPKTGHIAVICTYISEYIFPSILRGIENVTKEHDYQMVINSTNNSVASERTILAKLLENPVDGIIVEGTKTALPNPNKEFYHALAASGIPLVFINGYYPDISGKNVIHIVTDDYAGGYNATANMIANGHKNICGIFKSDDMQGTGRYSGYMDALVQMDASIDDNNVIWFSTETKELLLRNIGEFLNGIDRACTGVVCYNDQIADTVLRHFEDSQDHNIRCISSFDRCLPLSGRQIQVVSYSHPREKLGTAAAEKLFSMIRGNREESVVFQWE